MVTLQPLDKYIKQGVTYETPKRVAYVIRVLGTNSSGLGKLVIQGAELGEIDSDVAPLRKTDSNLLGPLDLGEYIYVIPPETEFYWDGDSGSLARIIGEIQFYDVGEGVPGDLLTRFKEQANKKIKAYVSTASLATDEVWKAGEEIEVFSITPSTIERIRFDDYIGIKIEGGSYSEGDFAVVFYIDDKPLEWNSAENLGLGIDVVNMPLPPTSSTNMVPFTLKEFPIELTGDHSLSIRVKNISGADKSPTSGSAWTVTVKLIGKYERT